MAKRKAAKPDMCHCGHLVGDHDSQLPGHPCINVGCRCEREPFGPNEWPGSAPAHLKRCSAQYEDRIRCWLKADHAGEHVSRRGNTRWSSVEVTSDPREATMCLRGSGGDVLSAWRRSQAETEHYWAPAFKPEIFALAIPITLRDGVTEGDVRSAWTGSPKCVCDHLKTDHPKGYCLENCPCGAFEEATPP